MDPGLRKILKGVSRSFYLSICLLPAKVRDIVGLAFLFCKAADTIADTELVPVGERLATLEGYRDHFVPPPTRGGGETISPSLDACPPAVWRGRGKGEGEEALLQSIPALFSTLENLPIADQSVVRELVLELTQGMQMDLRGEPIKTEADLDRYTYYVAGCVGRFWTGIMRNHYAFAKNWGPEVEACGEEFGKGLQMVNILRDLPRDLQKGRCYIPGSLLLKYQLATDDLRTGNLSKVTPMLMELVDQTSVKLSAARRYAAHFPWYARRLRAAVLLPMQLGFKTLDLLQKSDHWLDPNRPIKVSRLCVYRSLLRCVLGETR